jgi:hypothetical protein
MMEASGLGWQGERLVESTSLTFLSKTSDRTLFTKTAPHLSNQTTAHFFSSSQRNATLVRPKTANVVMRLPDTGGSHVSEINHPAQSENYLKVSDGYE